MVTYRIRTYIAGDWDHDKNAVEMLYSWNDSNHYGLSFSDAHELKQARDTSLNCTIKRSLADRMNASKTFVLIVGNNTRDLRSGGCQLCGSYNSWTKYCSHGYSVDYRSYVEYECEKAVLDGLNIIVLYNSTLVDRNKCPEILRWKGIHAKMQKREGDRLQWDYQSVKSAFDRI